MSTRRMLQISSIKLLSKQTGILLPAYIIPVLY